MELLNPKYNPYDKRTPKGRSGHCMSSDDANMYIFGGYSPSDERNAIDANKVLPELWKFNFATQKWTEIKTKDFPYPCASSSLVLHNGQILVFGGTDYPWGHLMSNTIGALNMSRQEDSNTVPSKMAWFLLETGPISNSCGGEVEDTGPPPLYGQSVILNRDALYVFGGLVGCYSQPIADLHKFSFCTMTWERMRPTGKVPSGRYKHEVATDDERFYVIGGGNLYYAECLDKVSVYHIARNHWTEETTIPDRKHGYPKPRGSFGFAQYKNSVYINGGRQYNISGSIAFVDQPLSDVWHLQLNTLEWTKSQIKLPVPLYFHRSVIAPSGHMYIYGGAQKDGFRSPYLYRVRLPFSVPKLSEMCWETVCELCRGKKALDKENMKELGIPWTFIERVETEENDK